MERDERHEMLLTAFADLPDRHRALLSLLVQDPPLGYTEISRRLDLPTGSIGPTRARALERIRKHPAVAAWTSANAGSSAALPVVGGDLSAPARGR